MEEWKPDHKFLDFLEKILFEGEDVDKPLLSEDPFYQVPDWEKYTIRFLVESMREGDNQVSRWMYESYYEQLYEDFKNSKLH